MSALPFGQGPLIIPPAGPAGTDGADGTDGSPGPAGPAPAGSAGDDVYLSGSGVAASRTAAAARAAHDATRQTSYAPPGASPWVLALGDAGTGPGSVAVVGDVLRLTLPAGAPGTCDHEGTWTAPRAVLTHGLDGSELEVLVRLAALDLGTLAAYSFGLEIHLENAARSLTQTLRVTSEGYYAVGFGIGGALTLNPTGGPLALDGTIWLKGIISRGMCCWAWGVGTASVPPTAWTEIWSGAHNRGGYYAPYPTRVVIALTSTGILAAPGTADVGPVLVRDLRAVAP